ncbi:MAG TPA: hypothetical protein VHP55_10845 [Usitatibacter sp.]|jgi:hypothetical protein|nr:hypothetical protein [Usitatibacter sp.]
MRALLAVVDFVGERFALPLIGLVSCSGLLGAHFFFPAMNAAMLADFRDAVRREEVIDMKRTTLVLALCAGCAGSPSGSALLPGRSPVPVTDAGDLVYPDGGDLVDVAPVADAVPAADLAPPAPDAMAFPACAELGYAETDYSTCDPGERTADQRYTCAVCNLPTQAPPPRWCLSKTKAGDRPSICTSGCGSCPVKVDDKGNVIDGGAP